MVSTSGKGVAAIVGVGSNLGAALARRFAAGYKVALVARSAEVIEVAHYQQRVALRPAYQAALKKNLVE
jgi:short-subunit dehydrogenase